MPLAILGARHFEHGETHTDLVNLATSTPPVTDEISTVSPDDGVYCKRYVFSNNDDVRYESGLVFTRGSISQSMLVQATLKISDLTQFDNVRVGIFGDSASGVFPVAAHFDASGGGSVIRLSSASFTSGSGATLATIPAGSFVSGIKNVVTFRMIQHDTTGEVQVRVNGATVAAATGVDTNQGTTVQVGWGWGLWISSNATGVGSPEARVSNLTFAQDGALADLKPQKYKAYVPDGVTAANDGVIFGGAATKWEALDEIPGTSADGITLNSSGHSQGLNYPTPAETNIRTVHALGQVGDSAAGSEQFRCDIGDGVGTNTGPTLGATADFSGRRLSNFVFTPPGAASWDAAKADLTATLVRTA